MREREIHQKTIENEVKIRPKIDAKSIQIVVAGRYRRTPKDSGYFRTGVWG
jgi:hypothetical protein